MNTVLALFRPLTLLLASYAMWATVATVASYALPSPAAELSALPVAGALLAALWLLRDWLAQRAQHVGELVARIPGPRWLIACLALGLILRLTWIAFVPVVQTSDHKSYLELARTIYQTGAYSTAGSHAYWPPGLPFALYPFVATLGDAWFVPAALNSVLFACGLVLVYVVGRDVVGPSGARIAALLLALWPNFIFGHGLAMKEGLVLVALTASFAAYLRADDRAHNDSLLRLLAGAALGAAILTQPSLILLPSAYLLFELLRGSTLGLTVKRLSLVALGIVLVVAPWTLRNHLVLDTFVPVSNTSGISLLVGNNPRATGTYVDVREFMPRGDEVTVNREAGRIAREWIRNNPGRFIELIYHKNVALLGDDSSGAYFALNHGLGIDDWRYAIAKAACNGFWLLILALLALGVITAWQGPRQQQARLTLMVLPLFYALAIHSVFESGSRHHAPYSGLLAVAAVAVCCRRGVTSKTTQANAAVA